VSPTPGSGPARLGDAGIRCPGTSVKLVRMPLKSSDKPFGSSVPGAILLVIVLYAVGLWLAFLADTGLFLLSGHVFLIAYAAAWELRADRKSRALYQRYESHLRRKNAQE
jgi:hypothetical protein